MSQGVPSAHKRGEKMKVLGTLLLCVMVAGCIFGSDDKSDDKNDKFSIVGTWYHTVASGDVWELALYDDGNFRYQVDQYKWYGTYSYNSTERKGFITFSEESGGDSYDFAVNNSDILILDMILEYEFIK